MINWRWVSHRTGSPSKSMATRKQTGKILWFYYCNETYFAVLSHIMEMAVFSLKFCRLCGQMQTLEWLKNDFHFAEICDEDVSDQPCCICLNSGTVQNTVEALLTDTRRKTAILMAALTKPCFNSNTNSSFSYSHKGTIFVGGWGHFRVYEKDFSFLCKFPKVENWNEISYASEFCILIN